MSWLLNSAAHWQYINKKMGSNKTSFTELVVVPDPANPCSKEKVMLQSSVNFLDDIEH